VPHEHDTGNFFSGEVTGIMLSEMPLKSICADTSIWRRDVLRCTAHQEGRKAGTIDRHPPDRPGEHSAGSGSEGF